MSRGFCILTLIHSRGKYSLSASLVHSFFGRQIASIKHQHWFDTKGQQHVHKFHAVQYISRFGENEMANISYLVTGRLQGKYWCLLKHSLMSNNEHAYWSVGSPLASFSAHENAPLCSQQYVSTATVWPRYFFTLMGSDASLRNCSRPEIPIFSCSSE